MRIPFFLLSLIVPGILVAQTWSYYGQDPGGKRYSTLTQVNNKNVSRLVPAWTFRTGELATYAGTNALQKAAFESTPILVGRTLYFSPPRDRVFAVDATNGVQKWRY